MVCGKKRGEFSEEKEESSRRRRRREEGKSRGERGGGGGARILVIENLFVYCRWSDAIHKVIKLEFDSLPVPSHSLVTSPVTSPLAEQRPHSSSFTGSSDYPPPPPPSSLHHSSSSRPQSEHSLSSPSRPNSFCTVSSSETSRPSSVRELSPYAEEGGGGGGGEEVEGTGGGGAQEN